MQVTLGGDRIGSGSGMKVAMHNYEMSTHNLKQRWSSTMGAGTLIPCLCIPAMRGDYFDIDINAAARTIPTKGPLFSSFKMQVDLYDVPMRLYQALLHNNAIRLGMNMSKVKLPKLNIYTSSDWKDAEFASNSLLKYLGMSGLGRQADPHVGNINRQINAIPALAYYDIFKNYYANKQEEKAYLISSNSNVEKVVEFVCTDIIADASIEEQEYTGDAKYGNKVFIYSSNSEELDGNPITIRLELEKGDADKIGLNEGDYSDQIFLQSNDFPILSAIGKPISLREASELKIGSANVFNISYDGGDEYYNIESVFVPSERDFTINIIYDTKDRTIKDELSLIEFDLDNIDEMRLDLLSYHTLGSPFVISNATQTGDKAVYLPYSVLTARDENGATLNKQALNGICVKTYQSDLFNNWLNTEWIEGENGIAEMSKVAVTDGAIYMDALLFAKKTYNLLNRVAAADGTYQSWLDTVYKESPKRHIETPMFVGGLSTEIVFEEIVQTTPTEGNALGTLGGRGILLKRKGGNAYIEIDEPSFIIGIVSITPRIYYTQGNEFYMTDLDSVDDMHKPEFDGIGFQNLLGERMCWTDTKIAGGLAVSRTVVGKVPAWIEYMTAVDKAYGEFTDVNKQGFMILNRNYSTDDNGAVLDFTTYIDPAKYNYAFANTAIDAQNFWVQVEFDIKARRKMSAREIPNL